ncbi:hypothetical protein ACIODS_28470 [Micromonospora chalcea]|uniref:hypothetical protein n=1 Tax=Micromonospora chalcea TaxID=1874 RepID=UPI003824ACA2
MPQRKLPSGSTARRAVIRSTKKAAASGRFLAPSKLSSLSKAPAKAIERIKKDPSLKSSSKPDKVKMPGFVGMLRDGPSDLAARAKDIVRGSDRDK